MTGSLQRSEPFAATRRLWAERYPSADIVFCGGSVVRGEGFPLSDLDVVVVFDHVANAWRESLYFEDWPVEVFAHDPGTLAHFAAQDLANGRPALAQMISEALVIPDETANSRAIQAWARNVVASQPELPTISALAEDRYWITDLVHDFRDDRAPAELRAVACKLYPLLCNFVLKTRGRWLGTGKTLPRLVQRAAPDLGDAVEAAFDTFFTTGKRTHVLRVIQQILEPFGGEMFDGFRSDAPTSARVPTSKIPWSTP